ncbi:MAG: IclR family transcriptional regulator, partial [Kiloniellales bacterium]|nr:IclR family transcriptional regulator [Kiloniellales bacterium]
LSLFDDTTIIHVVRQQSKREYFHSSLIGRRMPTFCSAGGRAMLAQLPEAQVKDIVARSELVPLTGQTITEPRRIFAKVKEARAKGFATILGECVIGEVALAAAVLDADGLPTAAVHIQGSAGEWTNEQFEQRFAPLAIETAQSLSRISATGQPQSDRRKMAG